MSRYRNVHTRMWSSEDFLSLSAPPPNAQSIWQYLLTGPQTTCIPGLMVIGPAAIAERFRWPLEDTRACFQEILDAGMAVWDEARCLLWLPKAIDHSEPASPNVVTSWRTVWNEMPSCQVKEEAWAALRSWLEIEKTPAFVAAFDKACRKPGARPGRPITRTAAKNTGDGERKASPKDDPMPSPKDGGEGYPKDYPQGYPQPSLDPSPNPEPDPEPEVHTHSARVRGESPVQVNPTAPPEPRTPSLPAQPPQAAPLSSPRPAPSDSPTNDQARHLLARMREFPVLVGVADEELAYACSAFAIAKPLAWLDRAIEDAAIKVANARGTKTDEEIRNMLTGFCRHAKAPRDDAPRSGGSAWQPTPIAPAPAIHPDVFAPKPVTTPEQEAAWREAARNAPRTIPASTGPVARPGRSAGAP
jgi:hypothetical protein